MRIVAGEWRGRVIAAPADARVRPTADRVREAWMSIVLPELPGARVLDLFAGSGALGLEALSRGAARATFVELSARSLSALRRNVTALGAGARTEVHRGDALRFIERLPPGAYDIAFADPPYELGIAGDLVALWHAVPFAMRLGVEHSVREIVPHGGDTRRYGDTAITFYSSERTP
jgi:16S rRNA (guanine966-N2)-methyltransferase